MRKLYTQSWKLPVKPGLEVAAKVDKSALNPAHMAIRSMRK
jgi:hypothetical protein